VSEEGRPYKTEKAQRVAFTRALKKLGIRHRPAYNMRHTYATVCLMAGMNPAFVANQLGHSVQMLLNVYSKWTNGAQDELEMSKLDAPMTPQLPRKPA
jgi:integrase